MYRVATVSLHTPLRTQSYDMMAALMPSKKGSRHRLLQFAFVLSIITYIDRRCARATDGCSDHGFHRLAGVFFYFWHSRRDLECVLV
jgi:hypothetical protein